MNNVNIEAMIKFKQMKRVKIAISISEQTHREVKKAAALHGVPLSTLFECACEMALSDEYFRGDREMDEEVIPSRNNKKRGTSDKK